MSSEGLNAMGRAEDDRIGIRTGEDSIVGPAGRRVPASSGPPGLGSVIGRQALSATQEPGGADLHMIAVGPEDVTMGGVGDEYLIADGQDRLIGWAGDDPVRAGR